MSFMTKKQVSIAADIDAYLGEIQFGGNAPGVERWWNLVGPNIRGDGRLDQSWSYAWAQLKVDGSVSGISPRFTTAAQKKTVHRYIEMAQKKLGLGSVEALAAEVKDLLK